MLIQNPICGKNEDDLNTFGGCRTSKKRKPVQDRYSLECLQSPRSGKPELAECRSVKDANAKQSTPSRCAPKQRYALWHTLKGHTLKSILIDTVYYVRKNVKGL
jgi:hypothetical protein